MPLGLEKTLLSNSPLQSMVIFHESLFINFSVTPKTYSLK